MFNSYEETSGFTMVQDSELLEVNGGHTNPPWDIVYLIAKVANSK